MIGINQRKAVYVTIQTSPPNLIRNLQVGDWHYSVASVAALVSLAIRDPDSQLAIGIHELIEAWMCRKVGITDEAVCEFDETYEAERAEGKHSEDEEPGDDPRCPYREQHAAATFVERAVCAAIGLPWKIHCQILNRVANDEKQSNTTSEDTSSLPS